jgi:hypothetical protein
MSDPTPGAQRAITPTTQLRADLRTVCAIIGSIIIATFAAALWANNLEHKVDDMRERQIRSELAMDQIRAALGIRLPVARTADDRQANP